ncbi:MAG: anaerobic sulfatase-maturation protein [Ignavibacteriae bacterium]|nr:anaerobic sulfatase-maturation protein [Ignavibacteriota bacterium]MCB9208878.1 anaerobic sulfatase-maturation protein [Ignavibacteriales bacterium]MCB9218204.1 anaerobic sulfatase-maturation protein [Ignavibacteriales bacterium]MCB9260705.1 anaerobic sulfatase-maturation protein [Ignavibacteriales bacterium]
MKNSFAFHIMTKPTGSLCNLDCTYCFYLEKEKLYPNNKNWAMNEKVLESYIRQYIATQKVDEITFAWQGGEPTILGVDYFRKVVELQKKHSLGKKINNSFQTNGVLLDDEWGSFLSSNNFLVGLSIDGPKEIHDKYRVFKGGQDSFDDVMNGISILKKHKVEFNTLTCVQRDNSYKPLEVYNFLKEIGSKYLQFIPIVERKAINKDAKNLELVSPNFLGEAKISDWSVEPLQYGKFLSSIFDEWVKKDVGNIFVQIFDISLEAWYGHEPSLCVFREKCGGAMAMEHNGDLYSCDHYVYPENKLGNIMTDILELMVDSGKQMKFGLDKKLSLPNYCKKCDYLFVCNGECPKHRFTKTPEGEDGLNYLCAGYKHFFSHIDPYMNFMVTELENQRPPANVMNWVKTSKSL